MPAGFYDYSPRAPWLQYQTVTVSKRWKSYTGLIYTEKRKKKFGHKQASNFDKFIKRTEVLAWYNDPRLQGRVVSKSEALPTSRRTYTPIGTPRTRRPDLQIGGTVKFYLLFFLILFRVVITNKNTFRNFIVAIFLGYAAHLRSSTVYVDLTYPSRPASIPL